MSAALVIVFFNRVEPLRRLVARLSELRPPKVYLISDGPRDGRSGEWEKVMQCREVMTKLPWDCEIKKSFAERNMGCRARVTSGLDWVFEQEDRAIILEDDCIPEPEFFPWVENMLERYKDNEKILSVGGTNLRPQLCEQDVDGVLTKYAMIWGWATWRRAWLKNDKNLDLVADACKRHQFKKWLGKWRAEWYWRYLLAHVKTSWGYRWAFTHFVHEAYCVIPPVNLVVNIGMSGSDSTHTSTNPYDLPRSTIGWQCGAEFKDVVANEKLDAWIEDNMFSRNLLQRSKWVLNKIKCVIGRCYVPQEI